MNFADLYRFSNTTLSGKNVPFRDLKAHVRAYHPHVGDVETWPVPINTEIAIAYMFYEEDRGSPYSEPFDVAVIRYAETLDQSWRRLVCCKEMMHIFDGSKGKTSSKERFFTLLEELETKPLEQDESDMCKAERQALWMALLVLFPERLRNAYVRDGMSKDDMRDIASIVKLPAAAIVPICSKYYLTALENLTGEVP